MTILDIPPLLLASGFPFDSGSAAQAPPTLDDRLNTILAAATAVVVFIGALVHLVLVARARLNALVGAIKGTESALDPLKHSHPEVYREAKGRLFATLTASGAQAAIAPLVESVIHGDGRPGTKPHSNPGLKAIDESDGP